ncbi:hypothetical protein HDU77_011834, partial [Chytriomyces hyalinus]
MAIEEWETEAALLSKIVVDFPTALLLVVFSTAAVVDLSSLLEAASEVVTDGTSFVVVSVGGSVAAVVSFEEAVSLADA